MLERGCISNSQFAMMLVLIVLGTSILFEPSGSVALGGRDAWLAPLLAGLTGIIVLLVMIQINRYYPGETPIEFVQSIFGKWIGGAVAAYLLWTTLLYFATILREFTDYTVTVALTNTPPVVILLLMIAVVIYGARKGLEVIVRISEFVFIVELIQIVASIFLFSLKDLHLQNLTPLFENGPLPLLRSSFFISNWFEEVFLAGFLLPFIRVKKGTKMAGMLGVSACALLLVIPNVFALGIFGDLVSARLHFGLYEVVRYVSIANFFERIDPITMGVWIMLIYCKLALYCYVISLGVAQLLRLKDYRLVVGIVCIGGAVMSQQMYGSQSEMKYFITTVGTVYGFAFFVVFPIVLLGAAWIRKRPQNRQAKAKG